MPARPAQAQQQPGARPAKQLRRAEQLFDSLFDDEEQELMQPAAAPAPAPSTAPSGNASDLAAAVQQRLQKHRARFSRRRTASQRQREDCEAEE